MFCRESHTYTVLNGASTSNGSSLYNGLAGVKRIYEVICETFPSSCSAIVPDFGTSTFGVVSHEHFLHHSAQHRVGSVLFVTRASDLKLCKPICSAGWAK